MEFPANAINARAVRRKVIPPELRQPSNTEYRGSAAIDFNQFRSDGLERILAASGGVVEGKSHGDGKGKKGRRV